MFYLEYLYCVYVRLVVAFPIVYGGVFLGKICSVLKKLFNLVPSLLSRLPVSAPPIHTFPWLFLLAAFVDFTCSLSDIACVLSFAFASFPSAMVDFPLYMY